MWQTGAEIQASCTNPSVSSNQAGWVRHMETSLVPQTKCHLGGEVVSIGEYFLYELDKIKGKVGVCLNERKEGRMGLSACSQ